MSRDTTLSVRDILRYDLPASIVVFLVALPLSIGIAIACGAPVEAGLLAAIIGGVVAGLMGSSALQVSGPAAGLTVVVAELIQNFGWRTTCFITACAGLLQILFGLSRIARAALAIAPVVVHAMLAGIGITIALQQAHVLLGGNPASKAWHNLTQLPSQIINVHGHSVLIGGVVLAILVGWRFVPEQVRRIPGPLVAVIIGTLLSLQFTDLPRIELSGSLLNAVELPSLPQGNWGGILTGVLTVALIASVESLLSAVAVDKMHSGPRCNFDRELVGQGSANFLSGLVGGLPVTGVIVRSSTNVFAGARTRFSAVAHGVWVLLFSVALVGLVEQIPKSALAGLLIFVGLQLVKVAHIKLAHRTGDLLVYAATVLGVVFLNLLEGVLVGLAIALALLLWRIAKVEVHAAPRGSHTDEWHVDITGSCTFLALPKLSKALSTVPAGVDVTVETYVDFMDHAAYESISEWARRHQETGGAVRMIELGAVHMEHALEGPPKKAMAGESKPSEPSKSPEPSPTPAPQDLESADTAATSKETSKALEPNA